MKKENFEKENFEKDDENKIVIINNISDHQSKSPRAISLIGEITEQKSEDVTNSLIFLAETGMEHLLLDPDNLDSDEVETIYKPIDLYISTYGGSATETFGIYDIMKHLQNNYEIRTHGFGKVMSAGVLLLAAGTKGTRRIGKNCRVMLHAVSAGYHGSIQKMENELEEVRWIQDRYVKCLAENTNMSARYIKNKLKKQIDVYMSADEAIKCGIADIIV